MLAFAPTAVLVTPVAIASCSPPNIVRPSLFCSSTLPYSSTALPFSPSRARLILATAPPAPPPSPPTDHRDDSGSSPFSLSPFLALWTRYNLALAQTPLRAKAATAGVLNGLADLLAQLITTDNVDAIRVARYGVFGALVAGPLGHFWFGALDAVFPLGARGVLGKVACDQMLFSPFILAAFFGGMAIMEGRGMRKSHQEVKDKVVPTLFTAWKVWPFLNLVNFGVVPPALRILFVNGASVIWIGFLSVMNGAEAPVDGTKIAKSL